MISWLDRLTIGILMASKPLLLPFTFETAVQKVRAFEDGWHARDLPKVSMACTAGSGWCNRAEFVKGRALSELGW
jgi:nuclear transport factor 2 (NTF2) superfamily protein